MKRNSLLFLMLLPIIVLAQDPIVQLNNITYTINGNYAKVKYASNCSGDIVIPTSVTYSINNIPRTATVTEIMERAFAGCTAVSITIPYTVTSISNDAFINCKDLASIIIDENNVMYDSRDNCNAIIKSNTNTLIAGCKNTIIPNTVENIGNCAFQGCSSLNSVTIPKSVISIGDYSFYGCSGLTSAIIQEGITNIGSGAFSDCSVLTSLTIPNSVTNIGNYAFSNCSALKNITMPNTVISLGNGAFHQTDWYIKQPEGMVYAGKIAYTYKGTMPSNSNIFIQEGTLAIACGAFSNCIGMTSASIPNSVELIGSEAFYNCSNLMIVNIGNSVNNIEDKAFYYCNKLTSVTLGKETPLVINSETFSKSNNAKLYVPYGSKTAYEAADYWKNFKEIIEMPSPAITFADANVKAICLTNWDKDGNGELSEAEAAAVTDLGQVFRGNTQISSFDELEYFTGITTIGAGTFYQCTGLKSVIIPNNVTSIGNMAFDGCNVLVSLNIPNSIISVGLQAFAHCKGLTSITIPNSVNLIGESAFLGCTGLTSMNVDKQNTFYDSRNNCNAIIRSSDNELLYGCINSTIPNSVNSIGFQAFSNCKGLTTITFPSSVTIIGANAFDGCSDLINVNITNSVTYIGGGAFYGTKWYDNQPDGLVYVGKVAYKYKGTMPDNTEIEIKEGTISISEGAFGGCTGLKLVKIPNSVIRICEGAFSGCTNLATVTIPNSVTSIETSTFLDCKSLTLVNIPNSVTSIGNAAFAYCESLTSIDIPNSVTYIGERAFYNCSRLTSVTIPNSVTSIGAYIFDGTPWYYYQTDGLLYIGSVAYKYKGEMPENTKIEIKEGTTTIYEFVFQNCSNLISINIPSSVTTIGAGAFYRCTGLSSLSVNATNIGCESFCGCYNITSLTIGDNVESIDQRAFASCSSLTSLTIHNGVIKIGDWAFTGCSSLTSVTIPNSVTEMGKGVFQYCNGLTSVTMENKTPITIYPSTFSNSANATLFVPAGAKEAYEKADYWKEFGCILEQGTVLTENNIIYAEDASVYIGYTADLQINMSNEDTFTAYQFDLVLPNGITLAKDEKGKYIVTLSNRHSDNTHQVTIDDIGDNTFRFVCVSLNTSVINGNDGTILTVSLKANNGIAEGELNATIKNVILTTADETKMKPKDSSFKIKTKTLLKGDADGDGEIDVTDVVSTINYIIGNPSAKFNFLAADLNEDGEVDIFDVMMAINLVFSQKNSSRSQTRATSGSEEQAIVKAADDRIIFGVNDASRFTAFQFDVEVANGVELKEVCLNADAHHDLQFVRIGQDTYRVIGISMDNSTLTTNGNDLVELRLSKECDAQISNIVFVTQDETKVHFAGSYVNLTDIGSITLDQSEEIFDLSGRKIDAERSSLPKGVYIINNKKVVVK